jgi:hypothetical protein
MQVFNPKLFLLPAFFLLIFSGNTYGQYPQWVQQLMNRGEADAHACAVAPNGNVYVAGSFTGDLNLDPVVSGRTINGKGGKDIFLACYAGNGAFQWGFAVGGTKDDVVQNVTADKDSNPIIVGQFHGQNVNFDPINNNKYLHSRGAADGYIAKYDKNGAYLWAISLGGNTEYDDIQAVTTDESGNVYAGGDFHGLMDIDPGAGTNSISSLDGTGCLLKYTAAGQLVWGFPFGGGGLAGIDNTVWGLRYGNDGHVYLAGCFQGSGDFDPSTTSSTVLTALDIDGYVSKYSVNGEFRFAEAIKGINGDQALDIALDPDKNIYVCGFTQSTVLNFGSSFSATSPHAKPTAPDLFLAKYNNTGAYQWGFVSGGAGNDYGWGVTFANGHLYTTGYMQQTIDFDPSAVVGSLTGKGRNDVFVCKYKPDGNFICGFNIGDTLNDNGRKITSDAAGNIYLCGLFSRTIDFDPHTSVLGKTSAGGTDGFLSKYEWVSAPTSPDGHLLGDTVCEGSVAYLEFIATAGEGPYDIQYSDGVNTYTVTDIKNGGWIPVSGKGAGKHVFTLTYIKSRGLCVPPASPDKPVTLIVLPRPSANAGADTSVCPGATIQLHGSGDGTYYWFSQGKLSAKDIPDPLATVDATTTYYLEVTNQYGCKDTSGIIVSVREFKPEVPERTDMCFGDTAQIKATGGDVYSWSPPEFLANADRAEVSVWPLEDKAYTVLIKDTVCNRAAILMAGVAVHALPEIKASAKDIDCGRPYGQVSASGGVKYEWQPVGGLSDATAASPFVRIEDDAVYTVTGTDQNGCSDTAQVVVKVFEGDGRLFAPSAFTPNGDGKNDCYKVRIPGDVSDFTLSIVNRFGQEVFRSHDVYDCWDGNFNGVQQPIGTYFYFYRGKSSTCDNLFRKGDIQLVR